MSDTTTPARAGATQFPPVQPLDEHNRALLAHTHPLDWVNPTPSGRYNLVVVGAARPGSSPPPAQPAWARRSRSSSGSCSAATA